MIECGNDVLEQLPEALLEEKLPIIERVPEGQALSLAHVARDHLLQEPFASLPSLLLLLEQVEEDGGTPIGTTDTE